MSKSNRIADLQLINRFCNDFEDQILAGSAPAIETALAIADESIKSELLAELLRIELFYLHQGGEHPTIESYVDRFPDNYDQVVFAFDSTRNRQVEDTTQLDYQTKKSMRADRETIGRFQIEHVLGSGAFADVYLAYDDQAHRPVAIKTIRPTRTKCSPELVDSFLEEANTLSQLSHPAIAKVYEIGRDENGLPFVVMEYVKGDSFWQLLTEKMLTARTAIQLIAESAEALVYVHQNDIFHRDLKPANIIVGLDGSPRIVDFGLAVHESVQRDRAGEFAGTTCYMSPEQVRREPHRIDGRSDIWALGVMLYEVLAGRKPFDGEAPLEIADEILHRSPRPPRQIAVDQAISQELESVCLKALEKKPENRYATAQDFADDLRTALENQPALEQVPDSLRAQTRLGRAELRLAGQAKIWNERSEHRRLPTFRQFVLILALTKMKMWTDGESRMMRTAISYYGKRVTIVVILSAIALVTGLQYLNFRSNQQLDRDLQELHKAEFPQVRDLVDKIRHRRKVIPKLLDEFESAIALSHDMAILNYSVALLRDDYLLTGFLDSGKENINWLDQQFAAVLEVPDTDAVRKIEAAGGRVENLFAYCSDLPFKKLASVSDRLAESHFRLARVSTYDCDASVSIAAIWLRDGRSSPFDSGMSRKQLEETDDRLIESAFQIDNEIHPDYFTDIRRLVDVRLSVSNKRTSITDKYTKQNLLGQWALRRLTKLEESIDGDSDLFEQYRLDVRFLLGRAEFYLQRYRSAVMNLTAVAKRSENWGYLALAMLAQIEAKRGEISSAEEHFMQTKEKLVKRQDDEDYNRWRTTYLAALKAKLMAFSERQKQGFQELDQQLDSDNTNAELMFYAACAYSAAAQHLRHNNKQLTDFYCERAIELLNRAMKLGFNKHHRFLTVSDLEAVRNHPNFASIYDSSRNFVTFCGYYNSIGENQVSTEVKLASGMSPKEHLHQCQKLVNKGFQPVSIFAIQTNRGDAPSVASVWHKPERQNLVKLLAATACAQLKLSLIQEKATAWTEFRRVFNTYDNQGFRNELASTISKFDVDLESLILQLQQQTEDRIRLIILLAIAKYYDVGRIPYDDRKRLSGIFSEFLPELEEHPNSEIRLAAKAVRTKLNFGGIGMPSERKPRDRR